MDMMVHIMHLCKMVIDIHTPTWGNSRMEVGVPMVILMIVDTTLIPNGGCDGHHSAASSGDCGPPDDLYGAGSERSPS